MGGGAEDFYSIILANILPAFTYLLPPLPTPFHI